LRRGGEQIVKSEARDIDGFDPDLIVMNSMSFAAKVVVQRRRNYQRILEKKRNWFQRMVENRGFVKIWDNEGYY